MVEKKLCTGCEACANVCPQKCITMIADDGGFNQPIIDEKRCIHCKLCEKVCPVDKDRKKNCSINNAYAVTNKNSEIRKVSSSGGTFDAIARHIIERNGVVCGAIFDDDFQIKHRIVDTYDGIDAIHGSKYAQSSIGMVYQECKKILEEGRLVLFTGTPCQIAAFKSFLMKEYDNLICQDIVCHGVPSRKVWKSYLEYRKKEDCEDEIIRVNFRDKATSWTNYAVSIEYRNSIYKKCHRDDYFMQAFLYELCSREACYNCRFKGIDRASDITLADFWGIQNIKSDLFDDKGNSLVIVHSEKGKEILRAIRSEVNLEEVNLDDVLYYNKSIIASPEPHKKRDWFLQNVDADNFAQCINNAFKVSIVDKGIRKLKNIRGKFK